MQAGVEWDAFNIDEMDSEEVRKEQGGYALPTQPQPRAWYLDKVASETAQAIGRPRAVNSTEKLIIQIWGGLQMTGFIDALAAHGITINEFLPNHVHRTAEDYQSRGSDLNAIHCVIDMLVSLKSSVSKRTVGKALRELGGGADDKVIQQCITDRIALGEIKPATKAHQTPPTAEILMGCDAYKEYICITPHEQNNKNSHLEEVETLLRSVSKKQTIATQPRAAAARKATLFRKQSAFIEEVRGFIDVLAAQGVTINEFMPDDIQVFEEQGDDHG
jgi:hypothetical protein